MKLTDALIMLGSAAFALFLFPPLSLPALKWRMTRFAGNMHRDNPGLDRGLFQRELYQRFCWPLPEHCFCGTPYIDRIMFDFKVERCASEICDQFYGHADEPAADGMETAKNAGE